MGLIVFRRSGAASAILKAARQAAANIKCGYFTLNQLTGGIGLCFRRHAHS